MNQLTIIGNLTADPQVRTTSSDKNVCNFTVAVNRRQKNENGENVADFFRVAAWGKLGDTCMKYLTKGRKVCVVGQVSVHAYADNEGNPRGSLEVFANEVEFLSPAGEQSSAPTEQPAQTGGFTAVESDELPF